MVEALPTPPVPPDADVRGFQSYPIDVTRLFKSAAWIKAPWMARGAVLALWFSAWQEVPAGSLPNDEDMLADAAKVGADWPAVREYALRGWVLHSDGRLYHAVVCEKVLDALTKRESQSKAGKKRWKNKRKLNDATATKRLSRGTASLKPPSLPYPNGRDPSLRSGSPDDVREAADLLGEVAAADSPAVNDAKGTRLPKTWTLPPAWRLTAIQMGLPEAQVDGRADEFKDYWLGRPGAGGRKADWEATWRNRVRNILEHQRGGQQTSNAGARLQRPAALTEHERRAAIVAAITEPVAAGRAGAGDGDAERADRVA